MRPYYFFSQTRKPLCIKGFRHRSHNLTPNLTHNKLSQIWLGWLTERGVHNRRKLFGFIILDLCVDVHRNFAVLVTCEVLNSFGIDRGIYQVGDICVAKLMRGNLEVQTIHHIAVVSGLLSENRSDRLGDLLSVDVAYIGRSLVERVTMYCPISST